MSGAQGFEIEDPITNAVIGAAIEVHRALGPGLLESVYHECMGMELEALGLEFQTEVLVPIVYRGRQLKAYHRVDLVVGGSVVVELKAIEALNKVHEAQLLTYLRLRGHRVGLLINLNVAVLRNGLKRLVV